MQFGTSFSGVLRGSQSGSKVLAWWGTGSITQQIHVKTPQLASSSLFIACDPLVVLRKISLRAANTLRFQILWSCLEASRQSPAHQAASFAHAILVELVGLPNTFTRMQVPLQSLTKMKWSNHTVILKECLRVEAANHRVFYLERLQVGGVKPAESQSKKAPGSWRCFQRWLLAFLLDRPTRSGKGLQLRYRWVWIVESWKGPFLSNARWSEYGWILGWIEIHPLSLSHHGTEGRKGIKPTVPLCSWFPEACVASKVGGHELLARGLVGVGEGERFRSSIILALQA